MQTGYEFVLADASCFILLDKIGELEVLQKLFGAVVTTPEIAHEFGKDLPGWVKTKSPSESRFVQVLQLEVDPGEASLMALALELKNHLLILDDYKARRLAVRLGLNYTGTLGIFLKAKEKGYLPTVKSMLEKIQRTNFRFSEQVMNNILREAGEE